MKKLLILLSVCCLSFLSCTNSEEELMTTNNTSESEIFEVSKLNNIFYNQFLAEGKTLVDLTAEVKMETRCDRFSNEKINNSISNLVDMSRTYLDELEFDYSEYFNDKDDPRIALVALTVCEAIDISNNSQLGTRLDNPVVSCALEASGLKGIITAAEKGLTKAVAKRIAKKAAVKFLGRAIPYVGWGLTIADFVYCMS